MKHLFIFFLITVFFCISGCRKQQAPKESFLPTVRIVTVEQSTWFPELEIIAETKPLKRVDLIPRVSGWLLKRNFKEGGYVRKGTVLYEMERDQYEIDVKRLRAQLEMAKARAMNAGSQYQRIAQLYRENVSAPQKYDTALADKLETDAAVLASEAALRQAELNLSYTRILAPFDGWIGISSREEGSYIPPGSGALNSIAYIEELRVEFELSDSSMTPEMRSLFQSGKAPDMTVSLLENGTRIYPLPGKIRFWNNRISKSTNTLRVQALFANPDRTLMPGMFVRVKLRPPQAENVLKFNKTALKQDLTSMYVYVVNGRDVIEQRRIVPGAEDGGQVIAKSGLKAGERLAVTASPLVRPGVKVRAIP